jgi:hypothetical protein
MKLLMNGKAMIDCRCVFLVPRNLKEKQPKNYSVQLVFRSLHVAKGIGFEE